LGTRTPLPRVAPARRIRIIVPGFPHRLTQRGDGRELIFFEDGDQEVYRDLLAEQTFKRDVEVSGPTV
jgi:putative transposase